MYPNDKLSEGELSAIQAQEYPIVIDDNGKPWYVNQIAKLNLENARLREALEDIKQDLTPYSAISIAGKALSSKESDNVS